MNTNHRQELIDAIDYLNHIIENCENTQKKFSVGTSQHSLLKNRIKALNIAICFMHEAIDTSNTKQNNSITKAELEQALPPLASIIHKCEKAQSKFQPETRQYNQYVKMLQTMKIAYGIVEEAYQKILISE